MKLKWVMALILISVGAGSAIGYFMYKYSCMTQNGAGTSNCCCQPIKR